MSQLVTYQNSRGSTLTYLNTLFHELAAITDEQIAHALPTDSVEETDTLLGTASREALTLFVLHGLTAEARQSKASDFETGLRDMTLREIDRRRNELDTLEKKLKTLKFLFWESIRMEFPKSEDVKVLSIREGGQIVALPQQEEEPMMMGGVISPEQLVELLGGRRQPGFFSRFFGG